MSLAHELTRTRAVLRREEWVLCAVTLASVIACYATGTGFSLWSVAYQYMSFFALNYMLVFMATRLLWSATQRGLKLTRYTSADALLAADHELARGGLWFFLAMSTYTNLKVRVPLLNSLVIDPLLDAVDRPFYALGVARLVALTQHSAWLDTWLTRIYLNDFVFVAIAVLLLHVRADALGLRILLLGSSLLFLLGIWVTALIPSYGPFVVRQDVWQWVTSHPMGAYQHSLLRGLMGVVQMIKAPHELDVHAGAGVAAFPSLHVAQLALVVLVCGTRSQLGFFAWITVLGTILTVITTLAYGWHYFVDALGGVALAYACFVLVSRLIGRTRDPALDELSALSTARPR